MNRTIFQDNNDSSSDARAAGPGEHADNDEAEGQVDVAPSAHTANRIVNTKGTAS
jgi:hypothetical protein